MELYFIRHGQSMNNHLYEVEGHNYNRLADPPLTDAGQKQAEEVAKFIANGGDDTTPTTNEAAVHNINGFELTHLYASPMVRAMDTANAIAGATGLAPEIWPEVYEMGGIWLADRETGERVGHAGNNRVFFAETYPNFAMPDWFDDVGWWNRPWESDDKTLARAEKFLADLQTKHGEQPHRVAVVSHGGFYNAMISALLGIPWRSGFWFMLNNVAITRIDFGDENKHKETRLAYQNRVDFLPPELIT